MHVRFVFKSPSGKPRAYTKRLPVVVGRSDSSDVRLRIPADSVSRRHCEFFLDDAGRVCLRDLGSTNGTSLDGTLLEPQVATPVPAKSAVKLGSVIFWVEWQAAGGEPDRDSGTIRMATTAVPPPATEDLPAEPAADELAAESEPQWPVADGPADADDKGLEDFFKGLS
jgi:predicted component of type VI protein secretion system